MSLACFVYATFILAAVDSSEVKPVGKPDAGNRHVRFDERGGETERASDTAPLLDSTRNLVRARIDGR
jgi:hypothetical protein